MPPSSKQPSRSAAAGRPSSAWFVIALAVALVLGLAVVWLIGGTPGAPEVQRLHGRWQRTDGGYVLEVRPGAAADQVEASYFNPRPINVVRAQAEQKADALALVVELRDTGYPGSTYALTYDPLRDELHGTYFQAANQVQFAVVFVRE